MECRGSVVDVASGESNEYVMGVMAKTGLSLDARSGKLAPGYDYWIIFSNSHVFTKHSHSSAYLNNPTVLEHKDFGEASWRIHRAAAEPVRSAADVRNASSIGNECRRRPRSPAPTRLDNTFWSTRSIDSFREKAR